MIEFWNGHKFDFGCASGALGFKGDGWWWEQPLRWAGVLRPQELTIITKTLTYKPRIGNLRHTCPWRAVRFIKGGTVNCVGLSNPGFDWWIREAYEHTQKRGYKIIVSIMPETPEEADSMVYHLNKLKGIVGVELNVSCPNVIHKGINWNTSFITSVARRYVAHSEHPVILKLSYQDNYVAICKELDSDGGVVAFDLINTVPWYIVFPKNRSPLLRYGYLGSVSGSCIKSYAREALKNIKTAGVTKPIISGGGIDSVQELRVRSVLGADGFTLGTMFLKEPWKVHSVVLQGRRELNSIRFHRNTLASVIDEIRKGQRARGFQGRSTEDIEAQLQESEI